MPNGLTLFNLFCGLYAIILATRKDFGAAPGYIVLGGIADTLDGRVARATGTGSRFGEELDSLVDAISFGFAPALIVYLGLPNPGNWEWLLIFFFTACAVMRLARFNVEQAGRKKTHFHGLPSPAAGLTLATYYWFRETPLYSQTVILFTDSKTLSDLPWQAILPGLMAILAALMISDVPYPNIPSIGFRTVKKVLGSIVVAGSLVLLLVRRKEFIFPALIAYVLFGAVKWLTLGFVGRSTTPGEIFWDERAEHREREARRHLADDDDEPDTDEEADAVVPHHEERPRDERPREDRPRDERPRDERPREERQPEDAAAQAARRKRRRRGRGGNRTPGSTPPGPPLPDSPSGPTE
ncbi:MAG: CDP-diacylglycerol--serine O-phosphatidyltransferase [bacterium]